MRFNKDIAKLVGAHDYHKVESAKIGTQFLVIPDFTRMIWDGKKPNWWPRATYYLPIKNDQVATNIETLMTFRQKESELEENLRKTKEEIKKYKTIIHTQITNKCSETGVIFINRKKKDVSIEKATFWKKIIRKGDKLVSFGIRFKGYNGDILYVAIIKYKGLMDNECERHYFTNLSFKGHSDRHTSGTNSVRIESIKSTSYKIETLWDQIDVLLPLSARDAAIIKNNEKKAAELAAQKKAKIAQRIAMKEAEAKLAINPPTARIFAYKGTLGVDIDMKNGKFLNKPKSELGCVINTKDVAITPGAVWLLSHARREGGSFAEIMLTKHSDGSGSSIGVMGFGKVFFDSFSIGRDCDTSVLNDCMICELKIPDDYKKHVDSSRK